MADAFDFSAVSSGIYLRNLGLLLLFLDLSILDKIY